MKNIQPTALAHTIDTINWDGAPKINGKVRESFSLSNNKRALVVTDRISAFDFVLGTVPFKGQVLNKIAAWWFNKIDGIVPHHLLSVPHGNVSIVKNVTVLPVEIIVRGYLTGTTKTSSWYAYNNLDRKICGLEMPAGMKKNEKFAQPIITPTTKPKAGSGEHDEPISKAEILAQGLVAPEVYEKVEEYALKMFAIGQAEAAKKGLILVDTKYEMGIDADGNLIVIDEIHTPDSSRYWVADSYEARMNADEEPEMLDKEFVRRMVVEAGYDVNDETQNPSDFLTDEVKLMASQKYIELYEKITGESFAFPNIETQMDDLLAALEANN
ncbi:phosphoribosylaminoimidazolesuccinocarboxamide synthase [bacterium DOLZORAL124_38_8]|nr:MAG: phosphoribosylaminoimidazolesuccinocarboxamide synthase [bacterium DOLZORAL124_38_8]